MSVSIPHVISGISIILLVIYGADVIVGGGRVEMDFYHLIL